MHKNIAQFIDVPPGQRQASREHEAVMPADNLDTLAKRDLKSSLTSIELESRVLTTE